MSDYLEKYPSFLKAMKNYLKSSLRTLEVAQSFQILEMIIQTKWLNFDISR